MLLVLVKLVLAAAAVRVLAWGSVVLRELSVLLRVLLLVCEGDEGK